MQVRDPVLGTRAEVHVAALDVDIATALETALFDELSRLEAIFTLFDDSSAMNEYRRTGKTAIEQLLVVAELATHWRTRTGGAFSPVCRPLADMWDLAEQRGAPPTDEQLRQVLAALGDGPTATQHLDFNAVAKGWIVDRALDSLFENTNEVKSAWLNIGGDLVHRGSGSLRVGIEDPNRPYDNVAPMAETEVCNEALATSGGARRFWTIDGVRYSKVLDPRTGRPVDRVRSATIVAGDAATADAIATAALVLSTEQTLELTSSEDAECFLVLADGQVVQSSDRFRPV